MLLGASVKASVHTRLVVRLIGRRIVAQTTEPMISRKQQETMIPSGWVTECRPTNRTNNRSCKRALTVSAGESDGEQIRTFLAALSNTEFH